MIRPQILLIALATLSYSADYFPLELGNTLRHYAVRSGDSTQHRAIVEWKVADDTIIDGKRIFTWRESWWDNDSLLGYGDYYLLSEGNYVLCSDQQTPIDSFSPLFQHTYRDGDTIVDNWGGKTTFHYIGKVTTAYGQFDSCFCTGAADRPGEIFAPNVGHIKSYDDRTLQFTLFEFTINPSSKVVSRRFSIGGLSIYMSDFGPDRTLRHNLFTPTGRLIEKYDISPTGVLVSAKPGVLSHCTRQLKVK